MFRACVCETYFISIKCTLTPQMYLGVCVCFFVYPTIHPFTTEKKHISHNIKRANYMLNSNATHAHDARTHGFIHHACLNNNQTVRSSALHSSPYYIFHFRAESGPHLWKVMVNIFTVCWCITLTGWRPTHGLQHAGLTYGIVVRRIHQRKID